MKRGKNEKDKPFKEPSNLKKTLSATDLGWDSATLQVRYVLGFTINCYDENWREEKWER